MIQHFNIDCMEYMRTCDDKSFDWAICDPMYIMPENYLIPGSGVTSHGVKRGDRSTAKRIAMAPPIGYDYYNELIRVSKNQIIWGINYFKFAGEVCGRIVWDKKNDGSTFSNCEIASISTIKGIRIFRYRWRGMLQEDMKNKEIRIHPFQKPVALYKWTLSKFCKPGDKILDTHHGSGSLSIACNDLGFSLVACENDEKCFTDMKKRFENHISQTRLLI